MAYRNNAFCWTGVITTDTAGARAFYADALGWGVVDAEMGGESVTLLAPGGAPRAHLRQPEAEGIPSHWNHYLRVQDVDALTDAAVANGGALLVPPTTIAPGRFSVVSSPSGASVTLFHEADEADATDHPGGLGGMHWVELHSKDVDADLAWLKSTFGFETDTMPTDNGPYYILKSDGEMCAGLLASPNPQAPAMWLGWVQVDAIGDAAARVQTHGGQVLMQGMEMPSVGKMAVVADPAGAVFGIIEPTA